MSRRWRSRVGVPTLALGLLLVPASPAPATTFCVPTFHPACPNSGGNVQQANLETAMQSNGDDGIADTIVIAAGTVTDSNTFELLNGDNDDLLIVGAGPGATQITSSASGNIFVVNLATAARDVTVRDLTIVVPASFPDNQGGALQSEEDALENVDMESRNVRSDGANSIVGGGSFRDGRIYGAAGGSIDDALNTNGAETGTLTVERMSIEDPSWGIVVDTPNVTTFVRRTRIFDPLAYGVRVTNGGFAVVENSIIEADTAFPIILESNDSGMVIATFRHNTILGPPDDPNDPAVRAVVQNAVGNGGINLVVSDTIIAGYENPLSCEAPTSGSIGNVNFTIRYSYFFHSAFVSGDCTLSNPNTIDAFTAGAPQFAGPGDYHLPPDSPAIDSGDPATVTLPTEDFDGFPRPFDGNGDGSARRDMGAFEYHPAAAAAPAPQGSVGDSTAPLITKLRVRRGLSAGDGGAVKLRLSEPATVKLLFRPIVDRRNGTSRALRRETVRRPVKLRYTGQAGKNKVRIKPGKLGPLSYKIKAIATDAAGNRSKPARTRVTVEH